MSGLLGEDRHRLEHLGVSPEAVEGAARALTASLRAGGKVLAFGNGGSAADAQHFCAELVGRFERERAPLPAVALTTDSSALTAIANDYGFEQVFARQVTALGRPGDVVLAISTSGSSPNILTAVAAARAGRLVTIGLCGRAGCDLCEVADISVVAPRTPTATVQEAHLVIEHALARAVENALSAPPENLPPGPGTVVSLEQLLELREGWRVAGREVVWTNGCFDILHAGHLASLEAARALGDVLVVGVNDDASVRRLKGEGRPVMAAEDRARLLAALRPVNHVVIFGDDTPEQILDRVRPDIHTKGEEYAGPDGRPVPERRVVEAYGGRVEFLKLLPGRSTTGFLGKLGREEP